MRVVSLAIGIVLGNILGTQALGLKGSQGANQSRMRGGGQGRRMAPLCLVFLLMITPAFAGPITIINTFGPGDSYTTSSPYTTQYAVDATAVQFVVSQPTVIDEVKVAGMGSLQLRWATNNGSNLPTTPFFGGVGLSVNGIADVKGIFGTLLPGTYWVEYLSDFMDPEQNLIYKNDQNISGLVGLDTTVDPFGQIDQTAWYSQTDLLPAIGLWGHTAVPEPASLVIFGAALAGLGLVRRRRKNM